MKRFALKVECSYKMQKMEFHLLDLNFNPSMKPLIPAQTKATNTAAPMASQNQFTSGPLDADSITPSAMSCSIPR